MQRQLCAPSTASMIFLPVPVKKETTHVDIILLFLSNTHSLPSLYLSPKFLL